MISSSRRRLLTTSAAILIAPGALRAEAWPARQIGMIAPYPPRGGTQEEVQAKMPNEMRRRADVIMKGNRKPS